MGKQKEFYDKPLFSIINYITWFLLGGLYFILLNIPLIFFYTLTSYNASLFSIALLFNIINLISINILIIIINNNILNIILLKTIYSFFKYIMDRFCFLWYIYEYIKMREKGW